MSRMTKFLRQSCSVARAVRDSQGNALVDRYGLPQYGAPSTYKCRKETSEEIIQVDNGRMVRSTAVYYFDDSVAVSIGDTIDGKPVLKVDDYVNAYGIRIGGEVYV